MQREIIDFDRLEIRPIKLSEDDISQLDCTENDGSDPLGVQDYLMNKVRPYHKGKVSTVYIVKQDAKVLAFFTLSMASLESKQLPESSKLEDFNAKYPAILLGQMGVDKKSRGNRLGELLCNYCVGFAENINEHIACRYIILQTNQANIDFYKKSGFQQSVKSNPEGKFWMYRRLSIEIEHVVNDTEGIIESVYAKVTPEKNKEEENK